MGKGSFGVVYSSPPYAIKQVLTNSTNKEVIIEEANILMSLNHPNIVRLFEVIQEGNYVYMVMEHCDMDLAQYRLKHRIYESEALLILKQVVEGLRYLLGQGLIHRDLKPANILYCQKQGKFKIADFGMAKYVDNSEEALLQTYAGTPLYMAPQLLCHRNYSTKCDIWSTGIIFYELVCGGHPWPSTSIGELHSKIKNVPLTIPCSLS
jgi:serine/threonine protein kinase